VQSPYIGRSLALAIIFGLLLWSGFRALSARPAESPSSAAKKPDLDEPLADKPTKATAVLAGGCFWGVQAVFEHLKGVKSVTSGYSGGFVNDPGYEAVSLGVTGHAESVEIVYDSSQVTFGQLLMVFFSVAHDPTQWNRQGPDTGSQYRSAIFFKSPEQQRIAEAYIAQVTAQKLYSRPIVTKVEPFKSFFRAENYHQDYLRKNPQNPYIVINDLPKLQRFKSALPELYRE
jgi:peptide-methionine (S)-S-oxide reductase